MSDLQHERLTALAVELRLTALPNLYGAVAPNFAPRQDASYADCLEAILRAERDARRVRVRDMLTRTAGFPALKTLDAYDFGFATGAPRQQIQELATRGFVERAENAALLGPGETESYCRESGDGDGRHLSLSSTARSAGASDRCEAACGRGSPDNPAA